MTSIAIRFTDDTVVKADNAEIDLGLVGIRIIQSDNEWSFVPFVNVKYLDVKETD